MYLNVNEAYSKFNSDLARNEKNDCVVRSLAVASGSNYETAHTFCKEEFGRTDKRGTDNLNIVTQMLKYSESGLKIGDKELKVEILPKARIKNVYKLRGEIIERQKTISSFIKDNPKGRFIVMVAKHALTIIDGEVFDWNGNKFKPTRKVQSAYMVEVKNDNNKQLNLFQNV